MMCSSRLPGTCRRTGSTCQSAIKLLPGSPAATNSAHPQREALRPNGLDIGTCLADDHGPWSGGVSYKPRRVVIRHTALGSYGSYSEGAQEIAIRTREGA
jgi:hypothetical protein